MTEDSDHLSVVCRQCGSEVSPYITECPYCGGRLRKRAPKLGSRQDPARQAERRRARQERKARASASAAFRRSDTSDRRPAVTIALTLVSVGVSVLVRSGFVPAGRLVAHGDPGTDRWKLFTAPFVHLEIAYAFAALFAFVVFGSWLERVLGHVAVAIVWIVAGAGGAWLATSSGLDVATGALAPAIAVTAARLFAVIEARRDGNDDDPVGVGVTLAVLLLLPPLVPGVSWYSAATGLAVGLIAGSAAVVRQRSERAG